jgi:hypothetical protein
VTALHTQSIDIQPSVVAHVAKGFALFGQEKYGYAVEAFNVALRQCEIHDRDVVLLIKVSRPSMYVSLLTSRLLLVHRVV